MGIEERDAGHRVAVVTSSPDGGDERHIRVGVLGPLLVVRGGEALHVEGWPSRPRRLLELLAISPGLARRREEMVELLWPDATPSAGTSNLRHSIHQLRRALGEDAVLTEGGWVRLSAAYRWSIDLARFDELIRIGLGGGPDAEAAQAEAVALYRGQPLPDARYDEWTEQVRERAERQWREVSLRLAGRRLQAGRAQEAVDLAEKVMAVDPLDEDAVRVLMRALAAVGRAPEAAIIYRQLAERLARELREEPSPETAGLAADLPRTTTPEPAALLAALPPAPVEVIPSYPLPAAGPFVGRDDTLAQVALTGGPGSRGDAPRLILLAGEAGTGKTRLLAEAALQAREAGALTLAGGCYEGEGRLPYGPIRDALLDYLRAVPYERLQLELGDMLADLSVILPELRHVLPANVPAAEPPSTAVTLSTGEEAPKMVPSPSTDDADRIRLFASVAAVLERMSATRPVLLLLDDLQWADEGTLQLLHYVARRLMARRPATRPPAAVAPANGAASAGTSAGQCCTLWIVGAYRQEEAATGSTLPGLAQYVEQSGVGRRISLRPLNEDEITRLLETELRGRLGEASAHMLWERSGGNPFFAIRMLALMRDEGRLLWTADRWDLPTTGRDTAAPPLPLEVREVVARRLQRLGAEAREALTLGAVLGREFDYGAMAAMWGGEDSSLFAALDAGVEAQVLVDTEEGYRFGHPLLREVVYERIPRARRPVLHGRAAFALETLHVRDIEAHVAELAHHFWLAAAIHGERAVQYLMRAGDAAGAAYAWEEAHTYYQRALELTPDGTTAATLLERDGRVLRPLARYDAALASLERAAGIWQARGDREGQARVAAAIGSTHAARGTLDEGIARIQPVLQMFKEGEVSLAHAALLGVLGSLHWPTMRYQEVLEIAERTAELTARLDGVEAQRILARAEMRRGTALAMLGQRADGVELVERSITLAEACGDLDTMAQALNNLATFRVIDGHFIQARETLERTLRIGRTLGDPTQIAHTLTYIGQVTFMLGDWRSAREYLNQTAAMEHMVPASRLTGFAPLCMGQLLLAQGEIDEGVAHIEEGIACFERSQDYGGLVLAEEYLADTELWSGHPDRALARMQALIDRFDLDEHSSPSTFAQAARARLELGDLAEAERLTVTGPALASAQAPLLRQYVCQTLGMLQTRLERWQQAIEALEEAIALGRSMPYPHVEGRALYLLGLTYKAAGDDERARDALSRALAIFQRLGAKPDVARTELALGATGRDSL